LRLAYHARIAEKLEKSNAQDKLPVADLAYHYIQAGNKEKSIKYSLVAGSNALARFSNLEAIKHFTYVLQVIGENPDFKDKKEATLEGIG
jgi:hypothetical protein